MSVLIKGCPSEGYYNLTYVDTTDKGRVALITSEDGVPFIGEVVDDASESDIYKEERCWTKRQ